MRAHRAAWRTSLIAACLVAGCYVSSSEAPPPRHTVQVQEPPAAQPPPQPASPGQVTGAPQPTAAAGPGAQAGVQQQTQAPRPQPQAQPQGADMTTARPLAFDEEVTGTVAAGQASWYRFDLADGQHVNFRTYAQCADEVDRCRSAMNTFVVDPLRGRLYNKRSGAAKQPDFTRSQGRFNPHMTGTYYLRVECADDCPSGGLNFKLEAALQGQPRAANAAEWWAPPAGAPLAGGAEGQAVAFALGQQMLGGEVGETPMHYEVTLPARQHVDYRAWSQCTQGDARCSATVDVTLLDASGGRLHNNRSGADVPPDFTYDRGSFRAREEGKYILRVSCNRCGDGSVRFRLLTRARE